MTCNCVYACHLALLATCSSLYLRNLWLSLEKKGVYSKRLKTKANDIRLNINGELSFELSKVADKIAGASHCELAGL